MVAAFVGVLAPLRGEIFSPLGGFFQAQRTLDRDRRLWFLGGALTCLVITTVILIADPRAAIVGIVTLTVSLCLFLPVLLDGIVFVFDRLQRPLAGASPYLAVIELRRALEPGSLARDGRDGSDCGVRQRLHTDGPPRSAERPQHRGQGPERDDRSVGLTGRCGERARDDPLHGGRRTAARAASRRALGAGISRGLPRHRRSPHMDHRDRRARFASRSRSISSWRATARSRTRGFGPAAG